MWKNVFLAVLTSFLWVFHTKSAADLDMHENWKYLPTEECGMAPPIDRIIGGEEAKLGQFPWMVLIEFEDVYCGGGLLNQYYAITAAHCTNVTLDNITATVGTIFNKYPYCGEKGCVSDAQVLSINKTYLMPNVDLALLEFSKPAEYNDNVRPVCLPRGDIVDHPEKYISAGEHFVTVAGWGSINNRLNTYVPELMFAELAVVTTDDCPGCCGPDKLQICAGGNKTFVCYGDSGSAAVQLQKLDKGPPRYFILGVTSAGSANRTCEETVGLFINVVFTLEWILDHVNKK
ncbi:chymotrypsinogen B-like [Cylas formicarius]|uniref:chymotrypsinogen B-like n=1 Tax=Cylas formicarius TaxID=197179 RepID=UPI00295854CF|nr:chymotrypsinogen B-like [Cylas formicarius]